MSNTGKISNGLKSALLLSMIGILLTCTIASYLCYGATSSYHNPAPFPDEDINKYIGKVVDWRVLNEIYQLIGERYPGHIPSTTTELIEWEEHWGKDRTGQPILWIHAKKLLVWEILDYGIDDNAVDHGNLKSPLKVGHIPIVER